MIKLTRQFIETSSLYPVTLCYVLAVVVMQLIAVGWLSLGYGILVLGVATVIIILVAVKHEMDLVRDLVVEERSEVCSQIEHVVELLEADTEPKMPTKNGTGL